MRTNVALATHLVDNSFSVMTQNLKGLKLEEALYSAGGYRSILAVLKHAAGWSHVYHAYAFEPSPKHWRGTAWPRGLRDQIETTQDYLDEVINWFHQSRDLWLGSLAGLTGAQLDEPRPLHWGETRPLFDIVVMISNHHVYHAGELNMLLSIARGEAWEEGEEVEENHISTVGHRLAPEWITTLPTYPIRQAVTDKSDDEIAKWIEGEGGPAKVMAGIFEAMKRNLRPEWKEDVVVGYEFSLGDGAYSYALTVKDRKVAVEGREPSDARVTLQISIPDYLRLITWQLDARDALSSGKLRLKGDQLFAQRLPNMFRV